MEQDLQCRLKGNGKSPLVLKAISTAWTWSLKEAFHFKRIVENEKTSEEKSEIGLLGFRVLRITRYTVFSNKLFLLEFL
jgi:hypothetical protein